MITDDAVTLLLVIEVVVSVLALGLVIGHGAHGAWRPRRLGERRTVARRALYEALDRGGPADVTEALHARLPFADRVELLGELAPNLSGAQHALLTRGAQDTGLLARADALCASRRWRQRLRGGRMFTLLGGGMATMPHLFDDPRPEVRAQVAEWAAGQSAADGVVVRLVRMLDDDDTLCRFTVEDSLVRLGQASIAPLAAHLRQARGDSARRALRIAAGVVDTRLLEPALAHCRDPEPEVRAAAAALIGAIGGERGTRALLALLPDVAAEVRAAAADGLGRLRHWSAAPPLADLLGDSAWDVRRAAGLALRDLGGVGTLTLQRSLTHDDAFARDMAQHILDIPRSSGVIVT